MALTKYKRHLTKCSGGFKEWDRSQTDCYCFYQVNGYLGGEYIRKNTYTFSADLANDMMKKAEKANAWPDVAGKEVKSGEVVTESRGHTIKLAVQDFLEHCIAPTGLNQAEVTMKMYRTALMRLMTFCHDNKVVYVEGLTPEVMAAFRATWAKWKSRTGIGIGVSTGNNYTTYLKGFGDWCLELGYAKKSFTNVLKYQDPEPMERPGYKPDELASILFAAETVDLTGCDVDNYRVVTFIHLMNEAGTAICDASLFRKVENVEGVATFYRKKMQGRKKRKLVRTLLTPMLQERLKKLEQDGLYHLGELEADGSRCQGYYFACGKTAIRSVTCCWRNYLKRVFKKAGIKGCKSHTFRHGVSQKLLSTYVTYPDGTVGLMAVDDVAALLGNDPKTVRDHYPELISERDKRILMTQRLIQAQDAAKAAAEAKAGNALN